MNKSRKAESNAALIQELNNLELEWQTIQKSMSSRNKPRTSFDELVLEKSPRSLMSCLQNGTSSPRPKNSSCDTAVEDILRDRRAAITSGKLKGRRLFEPVAEKVDDSDGEITSELLDMSQQRDVMVVDENNMSVDFVDQRCSLRSDDYNLVAEEKVVVVVVEEKSSRRVRGNVVSMCWFVFVLILVTIGLVCMSCSGMFVHDDELSLVPT
ncbi:hypothetical protein CASFOL_024714 [Castilleja foliolosa]|uniref:Uncharacterized protein n=1 Tax=Castilleja foliolosa TaxID=1961234 RepID=A0ABD3CP49_9LAMI